MNDLSKVEQEILAECRDDYVGLWSIVRRVRASGISDESMIFESTLSLLRDLLSRQNLVAGQFHDGRFEIWGESPQEIASRIKNEWIGLGRSPNIGEIAWFTCD